VPGGPATLWFHRAPANYVEDVISAPDSTEVTGAGRATLWRGAFFASTFAFAGFLATVFFAATFFVGAVFVAATFLTRAFLATAFLVEGFVSVEALTSATTSEPSIKNFDRVHHRCQPRGSLRFANRSHFRGLLAPSS